MFAAQFLDLVEDRAENIGLVVRDRAGEIGEVFRALDDRGDALEAHAGIDVALGQGREGAVGVGVELDEDEVPDLDATRIVGVDQRAAGVARRREIDVELGARAARAGVAHHPEVVLLVAVDDVDRRDRARRLRKAAPNDHALPGRTRSVR